MNLRPRVAVAPRTGLLLVGDAACIGLFSVAGVLRHGSGSLLVRVPEVALPFLLGWVLVGAFVGAFAPDALATPREAATRAAVAWVGADLVGQALRATPAFRGGADAAFFLVALFVAGGLLVVWRTLAARALGRGGAG